VTRRPAIAATLFAAVLWGTSFSVNDIGLRAISPATFVVLRCALGGGLLLAGLALARRLDASMLRRPAFYLLVLANAAAFVLQYHAQTLTTPARTAFIVNASVLIVALLDRVLLSTRLGPARLLAVAAGFLGAALLVTGGNVESLRGGRFAGDLLALASGAAWSFWLVLSKRELASSDAWSVTAWTFGLTALAALPALALDAAPLAVPPDAWWAILYAGVVTTALAFVLFTWGLARLHATASNVLVLVEILVATTISLALARESFTPADALGGAVLVGAVVAMGHLEQGEGAGGGRRT
jgi:drug/metabolite transporter (DMT)-like permease